MNSALKCHASVIQSNQLQQSLTIMLLVMLWKNILHSNRFRKPRSLAFSCNLMIQCLHFSEIPSAEKVSLPTFLQNVSYVKNKPGKPKERLRGHQLLKNQNTFSHSLTRADIFPGST